MQLIPFEQLKEILQEIENAPKAGYHRVYLETKLKKAIAAYDGVGFFKYVLFAPRYHQLIERARYYCSTFLEATNKK
jgi:hypothetical protein